VFVVEEVSLLLQVLGYRGKNLFAGEASASEAADTLISGVMRKVLCRARVLFVGV